VGLKFLADVCDHISEETPSVNSSLLSELHFAESGVSVRLLPAIIVALQSLEDLAEDRVLAFVIALASTREVVGLPPDDRNLRVALSWQLRNLGLNHLVLLC